jgi:general secretion pathway protein D
MIPTASRHGHHPGRARAARAAIAAVVAGAVLALPPVALPGLAADVSGSVSVPGSAPPSAPPSAAPAASAAPSGPEQMVTLDFNQVDLPTFIKFVSELTHQNFAIDDRVKGKVTLYAPKKIPVSRVYDVFQQVLELKGFGLVPSENVVQVLPLTDMPPQRDIYVYYLQNANAEEMAKVLTGIVSRSAQQAARRPRGPVTNLAGEFEGIVQILADPPTNSLIITASPTDYDSIKEVLEKLDIKRRQVYVEAVILEVTLDANSQVGVDVLGMEPVHTDRYTALGGSITSSSPVVGLYPASVTADAANAASTQTLATAVGNLSGLSLGAVRQFSLGGNTFFNVGAMVQAVANDANINVLSTPQILTSDNQKAEIVVGDNIPIITSNSQTTGGNFQTQVERKDVGITLRLTPQILESDLVKLDVFQEISNIRTNNPAGFDVNTQGVITSKKSATTTVIVQNDQTVVIGGLISDSINDTIKKVPLLGDIPLLGWLFKNRSKTTTKTNLLIFLTPHVIKTPEELFALQQGKSKELLDFIEGQHIDRKESRIDFLEQAINPPS